MSSKRRGAPEVSRCFPAGFSIHAVLPALRLDFEAGQRRATSLTFLESVIGRPASPEEHPASGTFSFSN